MEGYFSRDSMLRRVHRERVVGLFYGQRALCVGASHPLNYVVTAIHSTGKLTPFRRLARTAEMIEAIFFAGKAEADAALASVEKIHKTVKGVLPVNAGQYPIGTPYSALDPELLMWTIAVMADSAQYFFELFVHPLDTSEREAFWQDYLHFGELFGMPRATAPSTHSEFRDWWHERLASHRLHLTNEARRMGHAIAFELPMPSYAAPASSIHNAIMLGALPPRVRQLYALRYTSDDEASFRSAAEVVRLVRRLSPSWLRYGRNTYFFRWVARTERLRIKRGQPTPRLAVPVREDDHDVYRDTIR